MSFLAGGSEMAGRIRGFDWAAHPLGPPERWPQALRSALGICLNSAFPTAIYWGPELRLLYNDSWAPIPGPRHPAALGAPASEVWADIWHVIEPQFTRLLESGEGVFVEDQLLPMRRFGAPEETYWNYSFTPIRGEDGAIAGIFNSGNETTRTVLSQRQMRFLLAFDERLRAVSGAREARAAALSMLGAHVGAVRAGLCDGTSGKATLIEQWAAPGMSPLGPDLAPGLFAPGAANRVADLVCDPRLHAAFPDGGALLAVPWVEDDAAATVLFLQAAAPRAWTDFDEGSAREVAARTRAAIERDRAAQREVILAREIDHRAKNALAVVQSLVRLTRADDIATFRSKVEARIAALARAHGLLAMRHWTAIDLRDLVEQELAAYSPGEGFRMTLTGPEVELPAELAQTVILVVHELATNAAKHGALSRDRGALAVAWRLDADRVLHLDWLESAPDFAAPPDGLARAGFGSTLLTKVVEHQLGGRIARRWRADGLACEVAVPLAPKRLKAEVAAPPRAASRRVLIAEDEALVAIDLAAQVEALGFAVFAVAATVDEALEAIAQARPDVALLDANLRGRASLPVAERLHALGVPVIFATGYDRVADLPPTLEAAPRLRKPFSDADLARALADVLG